MWKNKKVPQKMLTTSEGREWMDRPAKKTWKKQFKKRSNKEIEAVYQLKNTSDCIQIDPPGPGQNLEKIGGGKRQKNDP